MRHVSCLLILLAALAMSLPAGHVQADVTLAGVFDDRMVVQRDRPLAIWGNATSGKTVTVEFAGQTKSAAADAKGSWRIMLDPLVGAAEGRALVAHAGAGNTAADRRVVNDVVVGDVWLLAGGATCGRMVMHQPNADAAAKEFAPAAFGLVRTAVVPQKTAAERVADVKLSWNAIGGGDPTRIPAEAALLAKAIADETRVPVGIVVISNPKPVECWMSRDALAAAPDAKPILDFYAGDVWKAIKTGTYEERMKAWLDYNQKLPLNPLPKPKPDDDTTLPQMEPASVWNAMVAPLTPMSIHGVVWHHGEDWQTQNRAVHQGKLLAELIPPGDTLSMHQICVLPSSSSNRIGTR